MENPSQRALEERLDKFIRKMEDDSKRERRADLFNSIYWGTLKVLAIVSLIETLILIAKTIF